MKNHCLKKLTQINNHINRTFAYSTPPPQKKKFKANPAPPCSTLEPEASSDSPLAKSEAVLLVSAKQEINQINDKGRERKINHK